MIPKLWKVTIGLVFNSALLLFWTTFSLPSWLSTDYYNVLVVVFMLLSFVWVLRN